MESEVNESIAEDNAYFKRMLDLIPPSQYFSQDNKQEMFEKMAQEQEEEEEEDAGKRKKKKKSKKKESKRSQNVFTNKLVSKIQEDLFTKETEPEDGYTQLRNGGPGTSSQSNSGPDPGSSSMDKRARLQARIEEFRAKRNYDAAQVFEKRLKKQENKIKLKQRRKELKQQGVVNPATKGGNTNKGSNSTTSSPTKPIFNKEGNMVFSKFDFTDSAKKVKKHNEFKGKDYKRLLDKIEKRNEKINKLKNTDQEAAQSYQDKIKWNSVMQKAQGEKVKDNPDILKKSMKRREKIKEKRQKKWEQRKDTVQKLVDAKQDKRKKHLKERKDAKIEKKMSKMKKKGRIIPGF